MSTSQLSDSPIVAVDLFCGGGGLSTALARAITNVALTRVESARDVDSDDIGYSELVEQHVELVAVNHDATAIETHKRNHPWATHLSESCGDQPRSLVEYET